MIESVLATSSLQSSTASQDADEWAAAEGALIYDSILVPIDFSEHSITTVRYAARLALRFDSSMKLLHVFEIPDYAAIHYKQQFQGAAQMESQMQVAELEAREKLTTFERRLLNNGVKVEAYLRVGIAFDEIVTMAKHFDSNLIVIGSHGHTGLLHLLLGSTAERVVEHAPCPVLVVKGSAQRQPRRNAPQQRQQ
jgi:universal stress protein A